MIVGFESSMRTDGNMPRWNGTTVLVSLCVLILFSACGGEAQPGGRSGTPIGTPALPESPPTPTGAPTPLPLRSLAPPLARAGFPQQEIGYPADWPIRLVYPASFTLVESAAGTLPGSNSGTWAAKYRYAGSPAEALELLTAHWKANEWEISERVPFAGQAVLILIVNELLDAEGVIVMDSPASVSSSTVISAAYFAASELGNR